MTKNTASQTGSGESRSKVFIVEDHPFFREGLVSMLKREPDLEVCGQAGDAEEALKQVPAAKPDVLLVDISLPGRSGLELIKELRRTDKKIKILVVSMHDEALYANRVLRAGGNGYIMKDEDPDELAQAIRDVLNGHIYVSEDVMGAKGGGSRARKTEPRPLDHLSDAELEILELLGKGQTSGQIAEHLRMTSAGIDKVAAGMRNKLGLKTDSDLLRYAVCWVETGRS